MPLRHILAFGTAILVGVSGRAEAQRVRGPNVERIRDQLSLAPVLRDLKLTPAQQDSTKAIDAKYAVQLDSLIDGMRAQALSGVQLDRKTVEAHTTSIDSLQSAKFKATRAVLAAEQWVTFDRNVEKRIGEIRDRRQGYQPPPG